MLTSALWPKPFLPTPMLPYTHAAAATVSSSDASGLIKLWDLRTYRCLQSFGKDWRSDAITGGWVRKVRVFWSPAIRIGSLCSSGAGLVRRRSRLLSADMMACADSHLR